MGDGLRARPAGNWTQTAGADGGGHLHAVCASDRAAFTFKASDVVAVLDEVCGKLGYPTTIRVDQGSEFVSRELDLWAYMHGVELDFSRPGKPTDDAFIESL